MRAASTAFKNFSIDLIHHHVIKKAPSIFYPFKLMTLAFFFAWIYTILPTINFWIYCFIRQQWWEFFTIIAFTEIFELCLPDVADEYYIISYFGFFLQPIISVPAYLYGQYGNTNVKMIAICSSVIWCNLVYGLNVFFFPLPTCSLEDLDCIRSYQTVKRANTGENGFTVEASDDSLTNDLKVVFDVNIFYDTFNFSMNPKPNHQSQLLSLVGGGHDNTEALLPSISKQMWLKVRERRDSESEVTSSNSSDPPETPLATNVPVFNPMCLEDQIDTRESNHPQKEERERETKGENDENNRFSFRNTWSYLQRSSLIMALSQLGNRLTQLTDIQPTPDDPPKYCWDCFGIFFRITYYLPRYYYRRLDRRNKLHRQRHNMLLYEDKRIQWMYGALLTSFFVSFLFFLVFFTNKFREVSSGNTVTTTGIIEIEYFFLFVLGSSCIRTALKRSGLALDRKKIGSISLFFVAEYIGLMFYYCFYRVLFESINSWALFFVFQVIHLVSEWILYPIRGSKVMLPVLKRFQKIFPCMRIIPKGTDHSDWLNFIAVDFGVRIVVMISTAVAVLLIVLTIDVCPWIGNDLRQSGSDIFKNALYLSLAAIFEIVNAILINYFFFAPSGIDLFEKVQYAFSNVKFALLVITIGTCIFLDIVYAFANDNTF